MEELKGKPVADLLKEEMIKKILKLKEENIFPNLVIIRLGDNPDDISYERSLLKFCSSVGVEVEVMELDRDLNNETLVDVIEKLNQNILVDGILIFRPLPKQLDISIIANSIDINKDVDCMNPNNLLPIFLGNLEGFQPSTAKGVVELLKFYEIDLVGKNILIVNRSEVVGKPLAMMLLKENATVTICHSKTSDLAEITKKADIVVTALGRAKFFDDKYFNKDSIVIDVGMSLDEDNKICGDVDYSKVSTLVKQITPVPGGVGRITTSILIKQLIDNIKR